MSQVFLSSTAEDLEDHRAAVLAVLTQLGRRPLAMEDFGARPGTAGEICAQLVAQSQLVVVVSAWRYGSLPPEEARSYTELEYDTAMAAGVPVLVYLVDPDHPWRPQDIDRGEAADRLARFRTEKLERRVAARFTSPNDLAAKVCADVARELRDAPARTGSGAMLDQIWPSVAPEVKIALMQAYVRAMERGKTTVSTEDLFVTFRDTSNTATPLMQALPPEGYKPDRPIVAETPDAIEALRFEGPYSHCVTSTLQRLTQEAREGKLVSAVDVAADLLIHGRGGSVARFRKADVDGATVNALIREARSVANDPGQMRGEIEALSREDRAMVAYRLGIATAEPPFADAPVDTLMKLTASEAGRARLLGEVLRCQPK